MISWIIAGIVIIATIIADILIKVIDHIENKKSKIEKRKGK